LAREVREPLSWVLALAALILSVAKVWNLTRLEVLAPYLAAVAIGFVGHELAHRNVARRYGLSAEFIAYIPGIIVTALTGFIPGIVIIAPGYVAVYSYYGASQRGAFYSVAAGPAFNIIVSFLALAASGFTTGTMRTYLGLTAQVNAWMAFFNLLPVPPLDGSKLLRWDMNTWAALMVAAAAAMFLA